MVDGKVKWVRERAYLEFDEAGSLLGGFGITQDITARKLAEEALRVSEEKYRSLFETIEEMVYRVRGRTGRQRDRSPSGGVPRRTVRSGRRRTVLERRFEARPAARSGNVWSRPHRPGSDKPWTRARCKCSEVYRPESGRRTRRHPWTSRLTRRLASPRSARRRHHRAQAGGRGAAAERSAVECGD